MTDTDKTPEKSYFVKPRDPDVVVRDPRTKRQLPPWGGRVPKNSFWTRRRIAKDVVDTTPSKIKAGKLAADKLAKAEAAAAKDRLTAAAKVASKTTAVKAAADKSRGDKSAKAVADKDKASGAPKTAVPQADADRSAATTSTEDANGDKE